MASLRKQKAAIAASFQDHLAWLSNRMPPPLPPQSQPPQNEPVKPTKPARHCNPPPGSNWNSTPRIFLFGIIIIICCIGLVLILDYWFLSPVSTVCPPSLERHSCIRQLG